MGNSKALPIIVGVVFFVCITAYLFELKFPIGCSPGPLKFIATFFHKCDY